ncbi:hypothetical protein ACP4OV_010077 [Aristida adscensionis]
MEHSGDGMPRQRAVRSIDRSSKKHEVAEDTMQNAVPLETAKHWEDADLEKTVMEDEILIQMVNKHGLNNWQTVACAIPERNAVQCRLRWKYSLDPAINREPWSEQEELRLIRAHQIYGNKWRNMVKHFPGRTNHALKEHWRGPMRKKLDPYLASGLVEQVPDLHDELPVPQSSVPDIPEDSSGAPDRNRLSTFSPPSSKPKQELKEQGENSDTSGGESPDCKYGKWLDAHSEEVSERITAKSKQRARARRKLDFLSTPVELKVCTAAANSQKPLLPKMEKMDLAAVNISPDVCQVGQPNVPSECLDTVLATAADNHSTDVYSLKTTDPSSMEPCEANAIDLLDMSYCDDLLIDLPSYPNGDSFI